LSIQHNGWRYKASTRKKAKAVWTFKYKGVGEVKVVQ